MKKLIITLAGLTLTVLLVFGIYNFNKTNKINYIPLGDSIAEGMNENFEIGKSYADFIKEYLKKEKKLSYYTKSYTKSGYTTEDVINDIKNKSELKKDLRESNLVTISIGANNVLRKVDKNNPEESLINLKEYVDEEKENIKDCIKEVRKYAKEDIIIVGYFNPLPNLFETRAKELDIMFAYIDIMYKDIAKEYDCTYVSMYQLFKKHKEYLPNPENIHPTEAGYKAMADLIIKETDM